MAKIEIKNLPIYNQTNNSSDSFIYELTDYGTIDVYGGINWGKIVRGIGLIIEGIFE